MVYSHADLSKLHPCMNPVQLEVAPPRPCEDTVATSPISLLRQEQQRPESPQSAKLQRKHRQRNPSTSSRDLPSPEPSLILENSAGRRTPSSPVASPPSTPKKLIKRNPYKALPPLPPTSPVPSRTRSLPAVPPISPRASRRTSSSESTICSNVSATLESPRTPGRSCYHPFNKSSRFVEDLDESEEQESEDLEEYVVVGSGGQSISNTNKLRKRYP